MKVLDMMSVPRVLSNPRSCFKAHDLHVIIPYANQLRYQSRYRLLLETVHHMLDSGVTLTVVDLAHGQRVHLEDLPPEVIHIKLRTRDEMWHKENMINIGVRAAIRQGAQYLAWVDGDVVFLNPYWATETIEALQTWDIIQPWSQSGDLDHNRRLITDVRHSYTHSLCSAWLNNLQKLWSYDPKITDAIALYPEKVSIVFSTSDPDRKPIQLGHPGYAWACRAEIFTALGGLLDWAIIGSADYQMALGFCGLLGQYVADLSAISSPTCQRKLLEFQTACDTVVRRNIGALDGMIAHRWHGPKSKRGYYTRTKVLEASGFDPERDLVYDDQGVYRFAGDNYILRDGLRAYFRSRDEDQLHTP